jgi:DNA damage-binding protein 1
MKSVSVVEYGYDAELSKHTLKEVARHHQVAWGTAVSEVDTNTYLESDCEGNLLVLKRDTDGATEDDQRKLHITSEIHLGEMVNRIRQVDVIPTDEAVVVPTAFLATVSSIDKTIT